MTSINTATQLLSLTSAGIASRAAAASGLNASSTTANDVAGPTDSTRVTLTQTPPVAHWPAYAQPVANGAVLTWQRVPSDALSLLMSGNMSTSSLGNRLDRIGSTLLSAIASGATSFSQTVSRSTSAAPATETDLALQQAKLRSGADNRFALSITTASGAQVTVSIGSSDSDVNGLSVEFSVTKGALTDAEREQLGKLGDAFQQAIDGLAKQPPAIDFSGLTGFDTALLTSVDLSATLGANGKTPQTVAFHADATQRTMHVEGATGKFDVNVDLTNLQAFGSPKAQKASLDAWLDRFDAAQTRGNGDAALMSLFKAAFSGLNTHYPPAATLPRIALSHADKSVLSGLADFSASISQTQTSPNPMRPSEVDGFDYRISQSTQIGGPNSLNRTIDQQTQATLSASYHRSLWAGVPLDLRDDPKTQNYEYVKVEDSAKSAVEVGYRDGLLTHAGASRSASQTTRVQRYEMAKLVSDVTTPVSASDSSNLMTLLQSITQNDIARAAKPSASATHDDDDDSPALADVRRRTVLEAGPAHLGAASET
ncbi:hypothetical protein AB870_23030 [Pandoraea faecigallinarum]|uniref:Lactate dehydrogenase n=1 Tax=Pandoraea faecigallinarum TaxID=656179 RepID=A0A0H3X2X2_9BURK|nr:hypothetical protein [Pandoraea faecigallinarum]AKM33141.2 hypothetical protein AB870_23030 [Pandoraea faecigallinarum]